MSESIREIITKESETLRDIESLSPVVASEKLVLLSSLLSSLNKYIVEKHYWFNVLKVEKLKEHGTAAKATVYANASNEWKELQEAVVQREALTELIRAIKYYIRASGDELREFTR